jgi:hypothetical protein
MMFGIGFFEAVFGAKRVRKEGGPSTGARRYSHGAPSNVTSACAAQYLLALVCKPLFLRRFCAFVCADDNDASLCLAAMKTQ